MSNRTSANEAWARECAAPAHDPDPWYRPGGARGEIDYPADPIAEAPEIRANRGLFADSGGAYDA